METKVNGDGNGQGKEYLIDVKAVAGRLGVSKATVWRLRDRGKLPQPVKVGSLTRWRAAELERWIEEGCPILASRG